MKKRTRNILIIVGVLLAVFAGLIGLGIWKVYSFLSEVSSYSNKEIPVELQETKVFKGEGVLQKSEIYKLKELSTGEIIAKTISITDEKEREKISKSEIAKGFYGYSDIKVCGEEIVAVGKFGGQVFDLNGNFKRDIYFELSVEKIKILFWTKEHYREALDELKIIDLENDGKCEFISNDSISGFTLFDNQGNFAWRYGKKDLDFLQNKTEAERDKEIYVTGAEVLDLNDDGVSEFLISQKNDGIRAFDINKNELWSQPEAFPTANFRLADIDGDGKTELLEFQGMSSTIRDKTNGNVIKKIEIDGWRKDILIYENEKKKQVARFFQIEDGKLSISDSENKVLLTTLAPLSEVPKKKVENKKPDFPAPTPIDLGNGLRLEPSMVESFDSDTESIVDPKAVWVKLQKDKPKYLAVVGSFGRLSRSNFYVYDEKGTLVYHELLPEDAETIAVLPTANAGEEILIGGKDTIWKFAVK